MKAFAKSATFWLADLWPAQAFCVLLRFFAVGFVLGVSAMGVLVWALHVAAFKRRQQLHHRESAHAPGRPQSLRTNRAPQYGHSAEPVSSIGR